MIVIRPPTTLCSWSEEESINIYIDVWPTWNETSATTLKKVAMQILQWNHTETWASWNYNQRMVGTTINRYVEATSVPENAQQRFREEDAERQRERQRQNEIRNQRHREEEFHRSAAKERAEKLLQSALTERQREELNTKGFFHCKSRIGTVYRIYRGSHGNVKRLNDAGNKEIERLCVQPYHVPEGDCMLAQKLHIENCEEEFRKTANITLLN